MFANKKRISKSDKQVFNLFFANVMQPRIFKLTFR
jgi:hypothetical protein